MMICDNLYQELFPWIKCTSWNLSCKKDDTSNKQIYILLFYLLDIYESPRETLVTESCL